jgi:hypothetical protein
LIYLSIKIIEVDEGIDSCSVKDLHAGRVVGGCIDMVDANCVGPYRLHEGGVQGALRAIDQRVVWNELVGDACARQSLPPIGSQLPFTNHWFPSLVKNLEPFVVIVGSETAKAAKFSTRKKSMVSKTPEADEVTSGERDDFAAVDERVNTMAITGLSPIFKGEWKWQPSGCSSAPTNIIRYRRISSAEAVVKLAVKRRPSIRHQSKVSRARVKKQVVGRAQLR